jgi:hypothetical protein
LRERFATLCRDSPNGFLFGNRKKDCLLLYSMGRIGASNRVILTSMHYFWAYCIVSLAAGLLAWYGNMWR